MNAAIQPEVMQNHNHGETISLTAAAFDVPKLMAKRDESLRTLNGAKADREFMKDQLAQQDDMIKRQEGSLIQLNQLILELDPNALKQQGG